MSKVIDSLSLRIWQAATKVFRLLATGEQREAKEYIALFSPFTMKKIRSALRRCYGAQWSKQMTQIARDIKNEQGK